MPEMPISGVVVGKKGKMREYQAIPLIIVSPVAYIAPYFCARRCPSKLYQAHEIAAASSSIFPAKTYERIRELQQRKIGTDMAVPDAHFRALYDFYTEEFAKERLQYIIFGHIGNSHVHANIFASTPEEFDHAKSVYHRCVLKALELGGTVSAEHGVGKIKRDYLRDMYGAEAMSDFAALKRVLDPKGLFGRGTMFA